MVPLPRLVRVPVLGAVAAHALGVRAGIDEIAPAILGLDPLSPDRLNDAMDAAQDAFVKVFRNINGFKGDSSFYTWLYRIVVNVCIDKIRKRRRARLRARLG